MTKYISLLLSLCLIFVALVGCGRAQDTTGNSHDTTTTLVPTTTAPQRQSYTYDSDWPHYSSVSALVEKADDIFVGTVVDLSFVVIDMKSGKIATSPAEGQDVKFMLYTLYEIQIHKLYKGTEESVKFLAINGGIPGFNEDAQYQAMEACGIYDGIPIWTGIETLEIGTEYLFVVRKARGDHYRILNPTQSTFAYDPDDEGNDPTVPSYSNILSYFNEASND